MSNESKEVRINPLGIEAGVFVSRLDIPWIKTPFLFEGILIEGDAEIETIRELCEFVFIDISRGKAPNPDFIIQDPEEECIELKNKLDKDHSSASNGVQKYHKYKDVNHQSKCTVNNKSSLDITSESIACDKKSLHESISLPSTSTPSRKSSEKNHNNIQITGSKVDNQSRSSSGKHKLDNQLTDYNSYSEDFKHRRKIIYHNITEFTQELKAAVDTHQKVSENLEKVLFDLKAGMNLDLTQVREGVRDLTNSIIRNPSAMTWVAHIKRLDKYSYSRALGTSILCATFGRHLGMEKEAIETLSLGGLLLDLGKSVLPTEFLQLTRKLSSAEFRIMKKHVQFGEKLLSEAIWGNLKQKTLNDIKIMVHQHHERADGSGYPNGLKNSDISFFARVAGIADSFDAMLSERPYTRSIKSPHKAVNELYDLRGKLFQSEMVEQFIQSVGIYPSGSLVELNTGEVGVVISVNNLKRLRPTLMLILDTEKKKMEKLTELSLEKTSADIFISHGVSTGTYDIDLNDLFI
jgi:HD-GYP domain-containing protein (c-di-GMP phosphodiesterase class II)